MTLDLTTASWYLARGSGVTALVLFSLVVALGIITRSARPVPGVPRFAVAALHSSAALLATVFLGVHLVTLLLDPYAQLRLLDLVVPVAGAYRPLWLGLGTLALDLILAIGVTSLLRARLGARVWKAVHLSAYALWPLAVLHGLGTGSDVGTTWLRATTLACVTGVLAAVAWRRAAADPRSSWTARASLGGAR